MVVQCVFSARMLARRISERIRTKLANGQLYVALGRVRRFADVRVWLRDDDVQGSLLPGRADFVTDNVVFGEVLT